MKKLMVPSATAKDGKQTLWERFGQLRVGPKFDVVVAALRHENTKEELPQAWCHPVTKKLLKNPTIYVLSTNWIPPLRYDDKGECLNELRWYTGTRSYDKKTISKQTLPLSHRPYTDVIAAVLKSLLFTPNMVLIQPRIGAFVGVETDWHTDANTRGAHPNAMRPLDVGGGCLLYMGCPFRCSRIHFDGLKVITLDLSPLSFRYVHWEEGSAYIQEVEASRFWSEVVWAPGGPRVIGSIGCCILSMKKGVPLTCPLDYTDIRPTSSDLDPLTEEEAYAYAESHPFVPPECLWKLVGADPQSWCVWYGWMNPHCYVGDPWARRIHVTGFPLRQNGSGQNRAAPEAPPQPTPFDGNQMETRIRMLRPGDVLEVKWAKGQSQVGMVQSVEDALEAGDMRVLMEYDICPSPGTTGTFTLTEHLAYKEWKVLCWTGDQ
jgi:hypothetical protein